MDINNYRIYIWEGAQVFPKLPFGEINSYDIEEGETIAGYLNKYNAISIDASSSLALKQGSRISVVPRDEFDNRGRNKKNVEFECSLYYHKIANLGRLEKLEGKKVTVAFIDFEKEVLIIKLDRLHLQKNEIKGGTLKNVSLFGRGRINKNTDIIHYQYNLTPTLPPALLNCNFQNFHGSYNDGWFFGDIKVVESSCFGGMAISNQKYHRTYSGEWQDVFKIVIADYDLFPYTRILHFGEDLSDGEKFPFAGNLIGDGGTSPKKDANITFLEGDQGAILIKENGILEYPINTKKGTISFWFSNFQDSMYVENSGLLDFSSLGLKVIGGVLYIGKETNSILDKTCFSGGELIGGKYHYTDNESPFRYQMKWENKKYILKMKMDRNNDDKEKEIRVRIIYTDGTATTASCQSGQILSLSSSVGKTIDYICGVHGFSSDVYIDLFNTFLWSDYVPDDTRIGSLLSSWNFFATSWNGSVITIVLNGRETIITGQIKPLLRIGKYLNGVKSSKMEMKGLAIRSVPTAISNLKFWYNTGNVYLLATSMTLEAYQGRLELLIIDQDRFSTRNKYRAILKDIPKNNILQISAKLNPTQGKLFFQCNESEIKVEAVVSNPRVNISGDINISSGKGKFLYLGLQNQFETFFSENKGKEIYNRNNPDHTLQILKGGFSTCENQYPANVRTAYRYNNGVYIPVKFPSKGFARCESALEFSDSIAKKIMKKNGEVWEKDYFNAFSPFLFSFDDIQDCGGKTKKKRQVYRSIEYNRIFKIIIFSTPLSSKENDDVQEIIGEEIYKVRRI